MCFGCWSAGGGTMKKCSLHVDANRKLKKSETMLLCRNWELPILRRRYRAEEIQELFLRKKSSIRYNVRHKKFLNVIEEKHQIYRELSQTVDKCNMKFSMRIRTKRWMFSLVDALYLGTLMYIFTYLCVYIYIHGYVFTHLRLHPFIYTRISKHSYISYIYIYMNIYSYLYKTYRQNRSPEDGSLSTITERKKK
jgi:hypothetical protein